MMTLLLIVAAVLVVAGLMLVVGQMMNDDAMWLIHLCAGTVPALCRILGAIFVAIINQNE